MGESYVEREGSRSEYTHYMRGRFRINNLSHFFNTSEISGREQLWCSICKRKQIPMTKEQLLNANLSTDFKERVQKECQDDKVYSWCTECGHYVKEPETEIVPAVWVKKELQHCVKCLEETQGKIFSFGPKLMYENLDDEDKPVRLGEPTATSPKRWYWFCSNCKYREVMTQSALQTRYVRDHTFAISQDSNRKKKSNMDKKEIEEVKSLFGGTPTSKVDEREEPPPGY